jgi:hypothetical protein
MRKNLLVFNRYSLEKSLKYIVPACLALLAFGLFSPGFMSADTFATLSQSQ